MRRMLTVSDRVEIASGLKAGWSIRAIASHIDRSPSVVSREIRRNRLASGRYAIVHADCQAERARRRPQERKVAVDEVLRARVLADLGRSRTPRQIAGRLRLEAQDDTVGLMRASPPAQGRTVSHEGLSIPVCKGCDGVTGGGRSGRGRRGRVGPVLPSSSWSLIPR